MKTTSTYTTLLIGLLLWTIAGFIQCTPTYKNCIEAYPNKFVFKVEAKDTTYITKRDTSYKLKYINSIPDTFIKVVNEGKLSIQVKRIHDTLHIKGNCNPDTIEIRIPDTTKLKEQIQKIKYENTDLREQADKKDYETLIGIILFLILGAAIGFATGKTRT